MRRAAHRCLARLRRPRPRASPAWADDRPTARARSGPTPRSTPARASSGRARPTARDLAIVYYRRGDLVPSEGRQDRALADYNELIQHQSEICEVVQRPRQCLEGQGDSTAPSSTTARRSGSIRNSPLAYFNRADVGRQGRHDRAKADLDDAIRLDPKDGLPTFNPRRDLEEEGRPGPGDPRLLRGHPARSEIVDRLFQPRHCVGRQGRHDPCHRRLDQALRLDPGFLRALQFPWIASSQEGRYRGAPARITMWCWPPRIRKRGAAPDRARPSCRPAVPASLDAAREGADGVGAIVPTRPTRRRSDGRRIALVIGNSAYKAVPVLPNARRDAETIGGDAAARSDSKREDGARPIPAKRCSMRCVFSRASADRADWALIYFAGHGLEVGGIEFPDPDRRQA